MMFLFLGPTELAPSDHRPHADEKLTRREGLRDVVVGPKLEAEDLVPFLGASRNHNDRDHACFRILFESTTDLPPIELRDHQIQEDGIRAEFADMVEDAGAIERQLDLITVLGEVIANQLGHIALVFHHEDPAETSTGGVAGPAMSFHYGGDLQICTHPAWSVAQWDYSWITSK